MKNLLHEWNQISLVKQIIIGLIVGIVLALVVPEQVSGITIFGDLFVGALKGVAPVLAFFLVMAAISGPKSGQKTNMKSIIILYLVGTFLAGTLAVVASFIFRIDLILTESTGDITPPSGISAVSYTHRPNRPLINHNSLQMAMTCGLDLPIMNPGAPDMVRAVDTYRLRRV